MSEHSPEQRAQIKTVLQSLRDEILIFLADETGATAIVELDQGTQGRVSRIDAIQAQKMAEAQRRRAELRLERVTNVLATADDEEFGCCWECGESIRFARLMARPDSVLCVDCAEAREGR